MWCVRAWPVALYSNNSMKTPSSVYSIGAPPLLSLGAVGQPVAGAARQPAPTALNTSGGPRQPETPYKNEQGGEANQSAACSCSSSNSSSSSSSSSNIKRVHTTDHHRLTAGYQRPPPAPPHPQPPWRHNHQLEAYPSNPNQHPSKQLTTTYTCNYHNTTHHLSTCQTNTSTYQTNYLTPTYTTFISTSPTHTAWYTTYTCTYQT